MARPEVARHCAEATSAFWPARLSDAPQELRSEFELSAPQLRCLRFYVGVDHAGAGGQTLLDRFLGCAGLHLPSRARCYLAALSRSSRRLYLVRDVGEDRMRFFDLLSRSEVPVWPSPSDPELERGDALAGRLLGDGRGLRLECDWQLLGSGLPQELLSIFHAALSEHDLNELAAARTLSPVLVEQDLLTWQTLIELHLGVHSGRMTAIYERVLLVHDRAAVERLLPAAGFEPDGPDDWRWHVAGSGIASFVGLQFETSTRARLRAFAEELMQAAVAALRAKAGDAMVQIGAETRPLPDDDEDDDIDDEQQDEDPEQQAQRWFGGD